MKRAQATLQEILNGPRPAVKGVMEYGHKTGGSIVLIPESAHADHVRRTRRSTYGSNLKFNR